jgi:solute carrier family 35 protein F1/2
VYAPTTQAFLNYCLLALVFGTVSILLPLNRHRQDVAAHKAGTAGSSSSNSSSLEAAAAKWARLRRSWPSFAALALIDVEANVLVTRAYQYTSLTSVTLLDCFTIPVVMLLSWLLLRARYKPGHYIGAVCCIAGLAVLVLGDSKTAGNSISTGGAPMGLFGLLKGILTGSSSSSSSSGSYPLLGDSLVLLGAVLYGICNVTQELLLSDVVPGQLLALLGAFGALISGVQAVLLEHHMLLSVHWGAASVYLPMAGFAAAMFAFYSLVPSVLLLGGATVLNLGLLTSDGWAALARSLWFGGFPGWSGYVFAGSLVLVAGGLVLYTLSGSTMDEGAADTQGIVGAGLRGGHSGGVAGVGLGIEYSRLQAAGDVEGQQGPACHPMCPELTQGVGSPPQRGSQ